MMLNHAAYYDDLATRLNCTKLPSCSWTEGQWPSVWKNKIAAIQTLLILSAALELLSDMSRLSRVVRINSQSSYYDPIQSLNQ